MNENDAKRSRARWAVALLLALAAGVVIGGLWLAYTPADDMIQGMADVDEVRVAAKVLARVERLEVAEGDDVRAGQTLALLSSPEIEARRAQAQAALASAQAVNRKVDRGVRAQELAAARAQWLRAQAQAELARKTYERTSNLYRDGVVAEQKRDEAQAQFAAAAETARAARAEYDKAAEGSRNEDKAAAGAQVAQAQGAVAEVSALAGETRLVAPADGQVSKRMANPGELVPAGYPLYTLVDLARTWVALNVREDQFHGLAIGRTLVGDIPALDRRGVAFVVYYINPQGEFATWRATRQSSGYDIKSFEVRVRPQSRVEGLRPGMSVLFRWPQT